MKEENGDTEDNLLELMGKYHQGYSTETQLLQTYRVIFLAHQAILFAGAFALTRLYEMGKMYVVFLMMIGVTMIGILLLLMWAFVCHTRSGRAENWRKEIKNLTTTENSPEAKFQNLLCQKDLSLSLIRFFFNFLMPAVLILGWVVFIWWSCQFI